MKKTILLAAEGFEEVEGLTVVDLLRRAGITCDIVSLSDQQSVTGAHGICVQADRRFSSILSETPDAVILPGGMPGTSNLAGDERVLAFLRKMHAGGKLTAAICAAPTVLAKAGLLSGKAATCYPGRETELDGAAFSTDSVVKDGTIITSRGLGTAIPFALALIAFLDSEACAEAVRKSIVYSG